MPHRYHGYAAANSSTASRVIESHIERHARKQYPGLTPNVPVRWPDVESCAGDVLLSCARLTSLTLLYNRYDIESTSIGAHVGALRKSNRTAPGTLARELSAKGAACLRAHARNAFEHVLAH